MIRLSKILCVAAMAFFCLLAGLGNASDYWTNFPAATQVFEMKNVFPNTNITYRAITNPTLHHAGYMCIISLEIISGLLMAWGAVALLRLRNSSAALFNKGKRWAVAGLTLGFLTWQVLFMSIGGEWFGMWMFPPFIGILTTAFHIFITMLAVLIYVVNKDE